MRNAIRFIKRNGGFPSHISNLLLFQFLFMNLQDFKFSRDKWQKEFTLALRQRVNDYFQTNNISKYANAAMVTKTVVLIGAFAALYAAIITGWVATPWLAILAWITLGIVTAGIGFSVMHDANHGAYSRNKYVNGVLGWVINLIGGFSVNWKIQHNTLHHSFTNVHGMDEDIDAGKLLRFSPEQEHLWFHRFQHLYAWFLYSLMTHMWITTKDFKQLFRYRNNGLLEQHSISFAGAFSHLLLVKVVYYAYLLVIPLVFSPFAWWVTLIGFLLMHSALGFLLGCVFQTAHVMESSHFPAADEDGNLEYNWAVHQLMTTTNYAPGNRLLSWFVGGLNYQVEHHLFPNICHIHYRKLSQIVSETAKEYNLPYKSLPTFREALRIHWRMLKTLGNGATVLPVAA